MRKATCLLVLTLIIFQGLAIALITNGGEKIKPPSKSMLIKIDHKSWTTTTWTTADVTVYKNKEYAPKDSISPYPENNVFHGVEQANIYFLKPGIYQIDSTKPETGDFIRHEFRINSLDNNKVGIISMFK